jgi:hypothetical protein
LGLITKVVVVRRLKSAREQLHFDEEEDEMESEEEFEAEEMGEEKEDKLNSSSI